MKAETALVKLLSDEDLASASRALVESIPRDQAMLAALKLEARRRRRRANETESHGGAATSALWTSDRPGFIERVAALAGETTYRVPTGGRGTKTDQLPGAHAIAAALAFGRRGEDDVGPDVAYCWITETDAYRQRVVRKLSVALQCHEFRKVANLRLTAAEAAWNAMVWNRPSARPANAPPEYDRMLLAAVGVLHQSAWDALAEAEKRLHRKTA